MTGEMFKAYTEQFLVPTLKRGDIMFMDNVSVHKVEGIEDAIEARGATPFYLPAYSPDLNPIEQLFAKLKALLRKIAAYTLKNSAFTVPSLCNAVAGASIKSPELNAPHPSQIQGMVNLNGKRSTAIFPRLSCRKAVQRTDDHLRLVFCAPRSIPAFPHAPPAGSWSSLLALVSACQGQCFFCELKAASDHRSANSTGATLNRTDTGG